MNEVIEAAPARAVAAAPRVSLIAKLAERFSVEPAKMVDTLKATAFRTDKPISNEQLMSLLIVADQYNLNPFTKEVFAFPDKGGIVPVVSVDGWARIINDHPQFDGVEFTFTVTEDGPACVCTMFRKDRSHPTVITEYLAECKRNTQPWQSHPRRMLRHKALIQCARVAFGFGGIFDEDEAARIVSRDMGPADVVEPVSTSAQRVRAVMPNAEPAVQAEPLPAPTAPVYDIAFFTAQLERASDAEIAGLVLDEARGLLNEGECEQLAAIYQAKWANT